MATYGIRNSSQQDIEAARAGNAPWPRLEVNSPDHGSVSGYSDITPMVVTRRSPSGKRLWAKEARAVLMNPPGSDAPDKLQTTPGGFVAHISGTQRWEFFEPDPETPEVEYSLRKSGNWVRKGVADTHGNSHARLRLGRLSAHYDYNF